MGHNDPTPTAKEKAVDWAPSRCHISRTRSPTTSTSSNASRRPGVNSRRPTGSRAPMPTPATRAEPWHAFSVKQPLADRALQTIETTIANLGLGAFWADEALEPGDPQRRREHTAYQHGAELLVRRGARRCLQCGARNVRGYCQSHRVPNSIRQSDNEQIKIVLRALAEAVGITSDGPRARRARRSPTHPPVLSTHLLSALVRNLTPRQLAPLSPSGEYDRGASGK